MNLKLSSFTLALVLGMLSIMFVLWCASLAILIERHNRQDAAAFVNNWHSQLLQLQQKQQLWLQSQYYLLGKLAEAPAQQRGLQTFLWGYYQRNPSIWAVNLVEFDRAGQPLSRSSKPGCLQPSQLHLDNFAEVPRIASCRIDDMALLEIAGPVGRGNDAMVLLISMDYFDFLNEFSLLAHRQLQRAADTEAGIQYREYSSSGNLGAPVSITLGDRGAVYGQLHLNAPQQSFWGLFRQQALIVLLALIGAGAVMLGLLHFKLVGPLSRLAEKMRLAAGGATDQPTLQPGLKMLDTHFNALQKLAKRDAVTGLNNRVIFEDRLQQAILEGQRSARKYALVMIDLRGIDEVIQQRGQYIADALLRQVADNLRQALSESDHAARFERNLFVLLLEVSQRDQLDSLVERIYLSVVRRYQVYSRQFDLHVYIGVALYPDHALDADSLYQNSSNALVRAEKSDWPILFFKDADETTDTSGFTLIQALRRAIDRNELKLVFQPVVDTESYSVVYFEALLRWKDPARHDQSIEHTIRLAEQNHLIKPLTNWIIDAACRFVAEANIPNLSLGINLSMIDLHDRQLPQRFETYLRQYGIKPGQIVIEITEGQIMQDPDEVVEVLAHLGVMGLSLSIDDFGTGQASLTYLKELPVEKLKIDQSFVRDIVSNPDDRLIVKATIELAHTLDLKVVAEGVETLAVCQLLADMHCDHMQGYYISHPLEAEQVANWLQASIKPDLVRPGK